MAEEKVYRSTECSWCLEEIEKGESVYELEDEIILHELCYNSLHRYPGAMNEGIKRELVYY